MRSRLSAGGILVQIAFRNLFASRMRTLVVGGIILFGAVLVVVGSSILDSVDVGMRRSIQGSLGGHIQIFNKESRDDLALYGGMMGDSDLTPITSFAAVKTALSKIDNVQRVVPMGLRDALVTTGSELDNALADLRDAVRQVSTDANDLALREQLQAKKDHVRHIVDLLRGDLESSDAITAASAIDKRDRADVERAASDAFWVEFDKDRLGALEFLDNRIAPQAVEANMIYLRYAGTDLDAFQQAFDRMRVVEGTPVPRGKRGILLAKFYSDDALKLKTARHLDKIKEARGRGRRLATDEELKRYMKDGLLRSRDILVQLDPQKQRRAVVALQRALKSSKDVLQDLLTELLTFDDNTFDERYAVFYREIAPLVRLHVVGVGDTLTLKAFTQAGYMKAINVKVYGIFEFKGLERSAFAGYTCLLDLMSFRDLYGYLTRERVEEIDALKQKSGATQLAREDAEAALFGASGNVVAAAKSQAFDEDVLVGKHMRESDDALFDRAYTQSEIDEGVALNAAVILRDPSRIDATISEIERVTSAAGLPIKAITWQAASGMIGQFITFARFVLYIAIAIIFAVALVIINNAMVMATLQRVTEIGTIRAIGAQRRFVFLMLLVESVAVGLAFGVLGAIVGVGVVALVRAAGGIPATSEQLYFFFSGPALLPSIGASSLAIAVCIVVVVSVLSGLYPAVIATRATPLQAMQTED